MSRQSTPSTVATIGIDVGKNTFHLVGFDPRGAIVFQLKTSRAQLERRFANLPRCLVGMEACSGTHHIGRQLEALGHDVRLIPAQYVKPFLKGHKNDYRDAEAIAEAVQRPTMHFVSIKTPDQMDLLALHRVRSRLVSQRTGAINQIRGFLIERGITVRQGPAPLRKALSEILSCNSATLSPRMVHLITDLAEDWPLAGCTLFAAHTAKPSANVRKPAALPHRPRRCACQAVDHRRGCRTRSGE
jgi:transposase